MRNGFSPAAACGAGSWPAPRSVAGQDATGKVRAARLPGATDRCFRRPSQVQQASIDPAPSLGCQPRKASANGMSRSGVEW